MRFTSNLATIITTGLLATTAIAGVIPASGANNGLGPRDLDEDEMLEIAKKVCAEGGVDDKKRSLLKREFVDMDEGKGAPPTEPLNTDGLSTCVGMVAVGTLKEGQTGNNHFMAHISMASDKGWNEFKTAYEADKDKLDNIKAYITTAQDSLTDENVRKVLEEDRDDVKDEEVIEMKEFLLEIVGHWRTELQNLVGSITAEGHHDVLTDNTMDSDGKGNVKVNGELISGPLIP